jgi:hypothetical protein
MTTPGIDGSSTRPNRSHLPTTLGRGLATALLATLAAVAGCDDEPGAGSGLAVWTVTLGSAEASPELGAVQIHVRFVGDGTFTKLPGGHFCESVDDVLFNAGNYLGENIASFAAIALAPFRVGREFLRCAVVMRTRPRASDFELEVIDAADYEARPVVLDPLEFEYAEYVRYAGAGSRDFCNDQAPAWWVQVGTRTAVQDVAALQADLTYTGGVGCFANDSEACEWLAGGDVDFAWGTRTGDVANVAAITLDPETFDGLVFRCLLRTEDPVDATTFDVHIIDAADSDVRPINGLELEVLDVTPQ